MVPSSICADAPLLPYCVAAACGRASARAGCDGGGCEDSRVRADYTIGGCEPHVRGWFLPVFWGGFGAWVKPKIKFAWFMRNILVGR